MNNHNRNTLEQTTTIEFNNHKFDVQIYFVDLDGTLLDKKITKKVSKKNLDAIKEKNKRFPVVISTGRSFSKKIHKLMAELGIKYAICQNGSIIVDNTGEVLLDIQLSQEQINKILEIAKKYRLHFTINSKIIYSTSNRFYWFWKLILWKNIQKFSAFQKNIKNVNKIVLVGTLNRKKISRIANEIKNNVNDVSVKTSGNDFVIEITDESATKGTGAIFISNILKVDPKNTIHIGDSQNDATTVGIVGALIAMKNASTKLLEVATHIGPANSKSGLSKVLNGEFKEIKRD